VHRPSSPHRAVSAALRLCRAAQMNGIYGLPQNPMVNVDKLHQRGLRLNQRGDHKNALEFFMQASFLAPSNPSHLISAANVLCVSTALFEPANTALLQPASTAASAAPPTRSHARLTA
tara:strand:+ start:175 stop:528 length:354 start_codon:yes stop_codon:yes gene_type:complete